jgi:hypothetical protein
MPRYGKKRHILKAKSASNQESEVNQIARADVPQGLEYSAHKKFALSGLLIYGLFYFFIGYPHRDLSHPCIDWPQIFGA